MPTRSLPVDSRSRRRPSGAGFRRTATQMALSRCAIAHRGVDWYFWRGTPAIACVAAQPPCSWHLPEAGQATAGRAQRLKPNGCIDIRLHPVTTTAIRHAQVPAVRYGSGNIRFSHSMRAEWPDLVRDNLLHRDVQCAERLVGNDHFLVAVRRVFEYRAPPRSGK